MRSLLVIEDGDEYTRFANAFLADAFRCQTARNGAEALACAAKAGVFLVDLRFDRLEPAAMVGDADEVARRLFGGDRARATRHLQDQQGLYILRALRQAGHAQRAVFVHDFSPRRLEHLKTLYGDVEAASGFDASTLRALLSGRA